MCDCGGSSERGTGKGRTGPAMDTVCLGMVSSLEDARKLDSEIVFSSHVFQRERKDAAIVQVEMCCLQSMY